MKAPQNPEAEWFGQTRVGPDEKTALVGDVFERVADKYDLMNDLMSGGLHRLWKKAFVARLRPRAGERILDVAGGTGDIAREILRVSHCGAQVTVCDINPAMMRVGRSRAMDHGLTHEIAWIQGDAESLPFPDESQDAVVISFGLRNVTRIDAALRSFYRVLKPGGRFLCMEFSPGVSPWLKPAYNAYCAHVLPRLGEWVAEDEAAYRYLAESIQRFPSQDNLAMRMSDAGFSMVQWENLTGGLAVIHRGRKT